MSLCCFHFDNLKRACGGWKRKKCGVFGSVDLITKLPSEQWFRGEQILLKWLTLATQEDNKQQQQQKPPQSSCTNDGNPSFGFCLIKISLVYLSRPIEPFHLGKRAVKSQKINKYLVQKVSITSFRKFRKLTRFSHPLGYRISNN